MKTYTLEVTEKQLNLISFIADKYSRLMAGQLTIALEDILIEAGERHRKDLDKYKIYDMANDACLKLEEDFWDLRGGQFYGVHYSENYNILTDINHVIRHHQYLERGETQKITVDAYPAHKYGNEPLIKIS